MADCWSGMRITLEKNDEGADLLVNFYLHVDRQQNGYNANDDNDNDDGDDDESLLMLRKWR